MASNRFPLAPYKRNASTHEIVFGAARCVHILCACVLVSCSLLFGAFILCITFVASEIDSTSRVRPFVPWAPFECSLAVSRLVWGFSANATAANANQRAFFCGSPAPLVRTHIPYSVCRDSMIMMVNASIKRAEQHGAQAHKNPL